jgi:hypothetical protein
LTLPRLPAIHNSVQPSSSTAGRSAADCSDRSDG